MIPRIIEAVVKKSLVKRRKIHLLWGARQTGKTTLLRSLQTKLENDGQKILYLNADLEEDRQSVDTSSLTVLKNRLDGYEYFLLDEAQMLENPGLTLKIIHDNFPTLRVLATGSSSFDLKSSAAEALTGRYVDYTLLPFSVAEIARDKNKSAYLLQDLLIFGSYPEIFLEKNPREKKTLLGKITESYLFKDILSFQKVRYSQALVDLTKALAYQIGSLVNENELANRLKIDRKTVVSYLDILEKAFVIIRLFPFSKNPRREIGRNCKIYFTDLGIRHALIDDFNPLAIRPDRGAIWENFLLLERRKMAANRGEKIEQKFWRSYGGAEVDYLERSGEEWRAFEFKYGQQKLSRGAGSFRRLYGQPVKLINQTNFPDFI